MTQYQPGDRVLIDAIVTDVDPAPLGAVTVLIPEASADGITDGVVFQIARAVVQPDPTDHASIAFEHEQAWWLVEPVNEEDM